MSGPVASSSATALSQTLAVVEEKDEAMVGRLEDLEDNVERLNAIIKETEVCLLQVGQESQIWLALPSFQKSRNA